MIKKFPLLLLALFYNSVCAQKLPLPNLPKDTASHFFGLSGQKKQAHNCISPQQRAFVEEQIKQNLIRLGMDNTASRARTAAHPLFVLPLKRAAGFTDPDYYYVINYVDLNPATGPNTWNQYGSTNLDYACGNRSYDQMGGGNHTGIDFWLFPFAWYKMANNQVEVIAAAAGTIIQKADGNDDQSCGSTYTGGPNTVTILHADGSRAYYYHLKKNSLTSKAVGQTVAQGEYLGVVGSSGFSTGPHLHFEVWDANFNVIEPFFINGGCNTTTSDSWWQQQIPYLDKQLVTSSIHDQSPFETCPPSNNNLHFVSDVVAGQAPYFYAWGKFSQFNDPVVFTLLRPDGTAYTTQTRFLLGNYYAWSLMENIRINPTEPAGEWTYRVTYNGQTFDRTFNVLIPAPKRLYVNAAATAGGNGTSWAQAFTNLQQAIDSATVSSEIWVAKGTYYPTKDRYGNSSPTDLRSRTFFIDKEIRIVGGFAGNEENWNPKNVAANPTVLSGDLGIQNDKADNAYNVVNFYHTFSNYFTDAPSKIYASLTGCTIRDGNANGSGYYPYFSGGGLLVDGRETGNSAEVIIAYCTFENNASNYIGGAIQFEGSYGGKTRGWIDHCTFINNRATNLGGAILANGYGGSADMLITNSSFTSNTANEGGAIYNFATNSYATGSQSNATIRNCLFTENAATYSGGAIFNDGRSGGISNAIISDCKFTGNRSVNNVGGAIYNTGSTAGTSNATINRSQFISNSAMQGGAIYNDGSDRGHANPIISDCIFTSNSGLHIAGAVCAWGYGGESSPAFTNCVFAQNTAQLGGVLYAVAGNSGNSRAQFLNCTLWSNVSTFGGVFHSDGGNGQASIFVLNSIIWGNSAVFNSFFTNIVIAHSLVQGNDCSALGIFINCNAGMIYNMDPQFRNPADLDGADDIYGTSDDGLTLRTCQPPISPAVNSGIDVFQSVNAPITDISGIPRTGMNGYDMGAYERSVHLDIDTGTVALIQPGSIISQSTITVAAPLNISPVYLKAGTSIVLNPGFSYVSTGETAQVFKAEIGECR